MRFFFAFFCLFLLSLALSLNISWSGGLYLTQGWVFLQESRNWFFHSSIFVSLFLERSTQSFLTPLDNDHPTCPRYSGSITSAGRRSLWASWRFGGFGKPNYPGDGLTAQHSRTSAPPLVEGQPSWDKKPPNKEGPSCQNRRQWMFYKWAALSGPRKSAGAVFVLIYRRLTLQEAGPHWVLLCFKWE